MAEVVDAYVALEALLGEGKRASHDTRIADEGVYPGLLVQGLGQIGNTIQISQVQLCGHNFALSQWALESCITTIIN